MPTSLLFAPDKEPDSKAISPPVRVDELRGRRAEHYRANLETSLQPHVGKLIAIWQDIDAEARRYGKSVAPCVGWLRGKLICQLQGSEDQILEILSEILLPNTSPEFTAGQYAYHLAYNKPDHGLYITRARHL